MKCSTGQAACILLNVLGGVNETKISLSNSGRTKQECNEVKERIDIKFVIEIREGYSFLSRQILRKPHQPMAVADRSTIYGTMIIPIL